MSEYEVSYYLDRTLHFEVRARSRRHAENLVREWIIRQISDILAEDRPTWGDLIDDKIGEQDGPIDE